METFFQSVIVIEFTFQLWMDWNCLKWFFTSCHLMFIGKVNANQRDFLFHRVALIVLILVVIYVVLAFVCHGVTLPSCFRWRLSFALGWWKTFWVYFSALWWYGWYLRRYLTCQYMLIHVCALCVWRAQDSSCQIVVHDGWGITLGITMNIPLVSLEWMVRTVKKVRRWVF